MSAFVLHAKNQLFQYSFWLNMTHTMFFFFNVDCILKEMSLNIKSDWISICKMNWVLVTCISFVSDMVFSIQYPFLMSTNTRQDSLLQTCFCHFCILFETWRFTFQVWLTIEMSLSKHIIYLNGNINWNQ